MNDRRMSWGEKREMPARLASACSRSNTDSGVRRRRAMRPALFTGTNNGPDSTPRTVSQAAMASLAPFVAYMIRALFPLPRRIVRAPDGKRWAADTTREVNRLAQETAEAMLREAFELSPDDPTRAERIKRAVATKSANRIRAMIELAEPRCAARPEEFDQDPFLVNCENGTLDLQTGKLRPHDPDDMLTKIVPVSYDPNATCPGFLAFLNCIFDGNKRLIGYVQRALGAALVGKVQEQVFHIFCGKGANGKTTLMETVADVLGAGCGDGYAKHAAGSSFLTRRNPDEIRGDLNRLKDARLVAASETKKGAVLDDATIKQLTGGDKVVNRDIFQKHEEYESPSHIFILTNYPPKIAATGYAMWRRVRRVEFAVTIPPEDQDLNLKDKLREELPGTLAWIVEGAVAVQKADGRLESVPEVTQAVEAYRHAMDDVGRFLRDCAVAGPGLTVGAQPLYDAYAAWCEEEGREPMKQGAFKKAGEERGCEHTRRNKGVVWLGLGLAKNIVLRVKHGCGRVTTLPAGYVRGTCACGEAVIAFGGVMNLSEAA